MAEQRNKQRKNSRRRSGGALFWLAFFILIICLFFINRGLIRTTVKNTHFLDFLLNRVPETTESVPQGDGGLEVLPEPARDGGVSPPGEPSPVPPIPLPAEETPGDTPQTAPGPGVEPAAATPQAPPEPRSEGTVRRERVLYFMRLDQDGTVVRTRVSRPLTLSDAPMTDALRSLLEGPSPEEQRRGLVSFIPPETKLLSVMVRGTTAYINFNQDFQFSTFGVEGYAAQLRQIVWTATEFSTVKDVQILIEGKRVDYLGESVLIGSPVSRENLN
jgi:spore germination protein GerM